MATSKLSIRHGTVRAPLACGAFAAIALCTFFFFSPTEETPLLVGYYALLLLNTFFGIKTIAAITPEDIIQVFFDGVLALVYVALAFCFGSILWFSALSFALFTIANGRYTHLAHLVPHKNFLRNKIQINWLGAVLSAATFAIATLGYPMLAAWTLFVCFAVGQLYFLVINPMYRLE